MQPTDLVDDREVKPVRFGGRRKRGAPVLRLRGDRLKLGAMAGALAGVPVAAAAGTLTNEGLVAIVAFLLCGGVGLVIGSKQRNDSCASCEGSLKVEDVECSRCDAPIGGEIKSLRHRVEGEERMRKARVAARKAAEAAGKRYEEDEEDEAPPPSSAA